jgi:uncharacterized protein YigE (DUF2233 family)
MQQIFSLARHVSNKHASLLVLLFCSLIATSQTRGYSSIPYGGTTFRAYTIKIDSYSVKRFELLTNTSDASHANMVNMANSKYGKCFMINGALADNGCSFIGLAINNGSELAPINTNNGSGAFYMKPNGVFSVNHKTAEVVETNYYRAANDKHIAIQSGPMLLNNGSVHPEFRENSTNRYYRSGVGVFTKNGETFVVFAVSNEPINLYTAAKFFRDKFGCNNALSLQSSSAATDIPFINANANTSNMKFCNYILYRE